MSNTAGAGGMSADMSQYLGLFLDEAQEQLAVLESCVLAMENGSSDTETLNTLFRAAHTVKGSSRAMGFLTIGNLTHAMEDALDLMRNGRLSVTPEVTDVLLGCLDTLGAMVASVQQTSSDEPDAPTQAAFVSLVERLKIIQGGNSSSTASAAPAADSSLPSAGAAAGGSAGSNALEGFTLDEEQTALLAALTADGHQPYCISVAIDEQCVMKSVRVFMVMAALEGLGVVAASNPSESELEQEKFDFDFKLLFAGSKPIIDIERALESIAELKSVTVALIELEAESEVVQQAPAPVLEIVTPRAASPAPVAAAPQSPAKPAPASAKAANASSASQTIRVDVTRLDSLLNLVGEMVIGRTQINELCGKLREKYRSDELLVGMAEASEQMARITAELQDEIMKTRMLPIDGVFQRYPRMVRDLTQKVGKEIDFQMSGGETELDRSVLEFIGDPILHILRNCLDHGVEPPADRVAAGKPRQGQVRLSAGYAENHIVVEITDDGRGIDPEKIKAKCLEKEIITPTQAQRMTDRDAVGLIFAPGFSTAEVVSEISGRGVGMDIAKSNIEKLGGQILVDSVVGKGSKFTIRLPLTLAIVRALIVEASGGVYVLPLSSVLETLRLDSAVSTGAAKRMNLMDSEVLLLRGKTVPLATLSGVLNGDPDATSPESIPEDAFVVIVGYGDKQVGLVVDRLKGQQETVIKSLGQFLGEIPTISGATILGNGQVALIVDVAKAVELVTTEERSLTLV